MDTTIRETNPEIEIEKTDVKKFRVNGSEAIGAIEETEVKGIKGYRESGAFCVISNRESQ